MDYRQIDMEELALMIEAGCTIATLKIEAGEIYIDADEHDSLTY